MMDDKVACRTGPARATQTLGSGSARSSGKSPFNQSRAAFSAWEVFAATGVQQRRRRSDRCTGPGPEDSHRDPRRWLRGGLHRPPPGEALQAPAGRRRPSGEPGQLPSHDAAAVRGRLGHPRSATLLLPCPGLLADHPVRRGNGAERRPETAESPRDVCRSKQRAALRPAGAGARGPDQPDHDPGLGERLHLQDARRRPASAQPPDRAPRARRHGTGPRAQARAADVRDHRQRAW